MRRNIPDIDHATWPERRRMNTRETSGYLRSLGVELAPQTLARYRVEGRGPVITYINGLPGYMPADVRAWVEETTQRATSTSARSAA